MQDSARISPTAHYTAYAWYQLGVEHAELFRTATGRSLFWAYKLLELPDRSWGRRSVLLRTLDNRHAVIDRCLEQWAPDRVVELGAGLSSRGLRWACRHGVPYTELDLPEMARLKRTLFEARAPAALRQQAAGRWRLQETDVLGDGFAAQLARELKGARRPAVVAEGLVGYFDRPRQLHLLETICGVLRGYSTASLVVDLRVRDRASARRQQLLRLGILVATRGRGAAPSFRSAEQVRALFEEAGYRDIHPLPNLDRGSPPVMSGVWQLEP